MSRIIKFRAWKKSESRMVEWKELICLRDYMLSDILTRVYLEALMQLTGLKARQDKELYEEDLVKIYYWLNGEVEKTRVDKIVFKYGRFELSSPLYRESILSSDIELIGNTYENPEIEVEHLPTWVN